MPIVRFWQTWVLNGSIKIIYPQVTLIHIDQKFIQQNHQENLGFRRKRGFTPMALQPKVSGEAVFGVPWVAAADSKLFQEMSETRLHQLPSFKT
jgi:hypothetical protein